MNLKSLLILGVIFLSCNDKPSVLSIYKTESNQLINLLAPQRYKNKDISKSIPVLDVVQKNDSIYKKLIKKGIINENTYIIFSNEGCISLVTRVKGDNVKFIDHVVTYNKSEGDFICNINSIYTLNQDENVDHLHIGAFQIDSFLTLSIIDNK